MCRLKADLAAIPQELACFSETHSLTGLELLKRARLSGWGAYEALFKWQFSQPHCTHEEEKF